MAKRKNSEESIPTIKEAAIRLFGTKGYASTSLDEIATSAGFTKGAVYYYFKSKETLLLDILQDIQERSIDKTISKIEASTGSPIEKLVTFIDMQSRWAGLYPNDLAIMMLTSIETANSEGKVADKVKAIYAKMENVLYELIDQAKANGEVPKSVATGDMVTALMANHDGNMLLWYRSGCKPEVGRMLAAAARHMLLDNFKTLSKALKGASSVT